MAVGSSGGLGLNEASQAHFKPRGLKALEELAPERFVGLVPSERTPVLVKDDASGVG